MTDNTIEQINPPTAPGLYEMRWTHGTDVMKEWRKYQVVEVDGHLVAGLHRGQFLPGGFWGSGRMLGMTAVEHFTGAEWRPVQED